METKPWSSYVCSATPDSLTVSTANCKDEGANKCQIEYKYTDAAGNTTNPPVSRQFSIDYTAPTVTINTPAAGAWENTNFAPTITNTDAGGSGLNQCFYRVLSSGVQTVARTQYVCTTNPMISVGAGRNCRNQGAKHLSGRVQQHRLGEKYGYDGDTAVFNRPGQAPVVQSARARLGYMGKNRLRCERYEL